MMGHRDECSFGVVPLSCCHDILVSTPRASGKCGPRNHRLTSYDLNTPMRATAGSLWPSSSTQPHHAQRRARDGSLEETLSQLIGLESSFGRCQVTHWAKDHCCEYHAYLPTSLSAVQRHHYGMYAVEQGPWLTHQLSNRWKYIKIKPIEGLLQDQLPQKPNMLNKWGYSMTPFSVEACLVVQN